MSRETRTSARLNLLPGGDFEQLDRLRAEGWAVYEHAPPTLRPRITLSADRPHNGDFSLRLEVLPPQAGAGLAAVESPPLWLESPPVSVAAGQLVRIEGWIRVVRAMEGSQDGALVFDSLGGSELGIRLFDGHDWQHFTMYRAVTDSRPIRLTVALTGSGAIEIDDFRITPLQRPPAAESSLAEQRTPEEPGPDSG
jgi:hypothetical protein